MELDSQRGCVQMEGSDVSRICSFLDHFLLLFFICNLFFMKAQAFPEHTEVRACLINPDQGCASSWPGSCLLLTAVFLCVCGSLPSAPPLAWIFSSGPGRPPSSSLFSTIFTFGLNSVILNHCFANNKFVLWRICICNIFYFLLGNLKFINYA